VLIGRRLLLIDGLPGAGKSTVAHLLCRHLRDHGHAARWYWELESPHPVFDFSDPIDGDTLREGFVEQALDRWLAFASTLAADDSMAIVESSLLQTAVQPMFALDWPASRIASYLAAVEDAIAPARPVLVLLRYSDVDAGFARSLAVRGAWFVDLLSEKLEATPYGRARQLSGADGVRAYLRAYQAMADALVAGLRMPVVVVDVRHDGNALIDAVTTALELPPLESAPARLPDPVPYVGVYKRADTDDTCQIVTDGEHLYVAGEPNLRLLPNGDHDFDVVGTCVQYRFRAGERRMDALECRGNLPQLAPLWIRTS
jgi:hypothetical protein